MEITAYTSQGCSSCGIVKELFQRASVEYKEITIHKDISLVEFKQTFPEVGGFPFVVIDGEKIGGLLEVAKLFVEKGLVSSKKS
jgi:glutaredoxin 3